MGTTPGSHWQFFWKKMKIFGNFFEKKRQVLGNFSTFKWQFSGEAAPDIGIKIDFLWGDCNNTIGRLPLYFYLDTHRHWKANWAPCHWQWHVTSEGHSDMTASWKMTATWPVHTEHRARADRQDWDQGGHRWTYIWSGWYKIDQIWDILVSRKSMWS